MERSRSWTLLAASVAGLLASVGMGTSRQQVHAHGEEGVACYGINKCQGTGDCGGKGYSCHGKNACNSQGFIMLDEEDCLRIENGRLTAEPGDGGAG